LRIKLTLDPALLDADLKLPALNDGLYRITINTNQLTGKSHGFKIKKVESK